MAQRIPRDESLSRVHGVGSLFAAAYGNVGSSCRVLLTAPPEV